MLSSNSLRQTVYTTASRLRFLNRGPSAHDSSMSPIFVYITSVGTVQVNWSTDSGSTENARLENRKLFKILFKLLYLRFPPLHIRTCVFRTCIFHPAVGLLSFSVLAFSVAPAYAAGAI